MTPFMFNIVSSMLGLHRFLSTKRTPSLMFKNCVLLGFIRVHGIIIKYTHNYMWLVPDETVHLSHIPSLVWHTRHLNPRYYRCSLLYLPISNFLFSIIIYRWTHNRIQEEMRRNNTPRTAAPETSARAWTLQFLDKGVNPKKEGCIFYSSQYGYFSSFSYLFCLNKDANHLLLADLPGSRLRGILILDIIVAIYSIYQFQIYISLL